MARGPAAPSFTSDELGLRSTPRNGGSSFGFGNPRKVPKVPERRWALEHKLHGSLPQEIS